MKVNSFTEKVGELVGQDKLKGAIDLLHTLLKDSPKLDEVILQSSRLTDLMKQIRSGTVNFEDASITKNKIRMAILSLCSELEHSVENNDELQKEFDEKMDSKRYPTITIHQENYGTGDNVAGDKIINN